MRIPVVMGGVTGPGDAVLVEEGVTFAGAGYVVGFTVGRVGHMAGCVCCGGRSGMAELLSGLFMARVRGEAPFFRRVVVVASAAGEAAVREAVEGDVVARARFVVNGEVG